MAIVCNELLGRELLKIYQDPDYFSFSLDSMLLASFASITKRVENICDLCEFDVSLSILHPTKNKQQIKDKKDRKIRSDFFCIIYHLK